MKKWFMISLMMILIMFIIYISAYRMLLPQIKEIGKAKLEQINQLIVTHSYFTHETIYDSLIKIERNQQEEIQAIHFDMIKLNELCNEVVLDIENTYAQIQNKNYIKKDESNYENKISELSNQGIYVTIPISTFFKLPIPYFHINVRFEQLSTVSGSITKQVENYGMNHIMAQINMEITLKHTIQYPFFEQGNEQVIQIPILLEIYEGQVPQYYKQGEL